MSRIKLVVFSMLPAIVLFGCTEAALRLYVAIKVSQQEGTGLPPPAMRNLYQREDPVLGYALVPGYDANGIRINQLGFRGAEIRKQKSPATLRIIAIGDSTTFGLAGEACPYPAQLEKLLARAVRRPVEVVNAGVEGYSVIYALRLYRYRVRELRPDIVIIYIGWNDIYSVNPFQPNVAQLHEILSASEKPAREDGILAKIDRALTRLYLAQWLRRILFVELPRLTAKRTPDPAGRGIDLSMTDAYRTRLTELVRMVHGDGAIPVLTTLPSVLSEPMPERAFSIVHYPTWANGDPFLLLKVVNHFNDVIRDVAKKEGAFLVDNAAEFDSLQGKANLFFDTLHMYCDGYAIVARNIAEKILGQGIVH